MINEKTTMHQLESEENMSFLRPLILSPNGLSYEFTSPSPSRFVASFLLHPPKRSRENLDFWETRPFLIFQVYKSMIRILPNMSTNF